MNICSQCGAYISGSIHVCFLNMGNTTTTNTVPSSIASPRWLPAPTQMFTATIPHPLTIEASTPRIYTAEQVSALLDRLVPALKELDTRGYSERAAGYAEAVYELSEVVAGLKAEIEGSNPEPKEDDDTNGWAAEQS